MQPDFAAAERCVAEVASQGIDVDALEESLQREGAKALEADWVALLDSVSTKAGQLRSS